MIVGIVAIAWNHRRGRSPIRGPRRGCRRAVTAPAPEDEADYYPPVESVTEEDEADEADEAEEADDADDEEEPDEAPTQPRAGPTTAGDLG